MLDDYHYYTLLYYKIENYIQPYDNCSNVGPFSIQESSTTVYSIISFEPRKNVKYLVIIDK